MRIKTAALLVPVITFGLLSARNAPVTSAQGADPAGAETQPDAPAKKTFRSLVIAGLPTVASRNMEQLCELLSRESGVKFQPEWWRLDMGAFSTEQPFGGAELAAKLRMVVISDVSDNLIIAAEETPVTRQAEARVFMLQLFAGENAGPMWDGIATKTGMIERGQRNMYGVNTGNNRPQPELDPEAEVFSVNGQLDDPKVLAALGLLPEQIAVPMKHYQISQFRVGPYSPATNNNRNRYTSYSSFNDPFASGAEPRGALVVYAETGGQMDNVPEGPTLPKELNMLSAFSGAFNQVGMMMMRAMGGFSYTSYESSMSDAEKIQENAQFVCMLMRDFKPTKTLDTAAKQRFADGLARFKAANSLAPVPEQIEKFREHTELHQLLKQHSINMRPRQITWADTTAFNLMQDSLDEGAKYSAYKNQFRDKAVEVFQTWARSKGAGAEVMEGRLGNWEVMQHYGYDWGTFNIGEYEAYSIEIAKESDPGLSGYMVIRTTDGITAPRAFSFRLDPASGAAFWLSGEPEDRAVVKERAKELVEGVELLVKGVTELGDFAPASGWIANKFSAAGKSWKHVSVLDFRVKRLAPGMIRIEGQGMSPASRVSVIVNPADGSVVWETAKIKE